MGAHLLLGPEQVEARSRELLLPFLEGLQLPSRSLLLHAGHPSTKLLSDRHRPCDGFGSVGLLASLRISELLFICISWFK